MGTKGKNACNVHGVKQPALSKYKLLLSLFCVIPERELQFMGESEKWENSESTQRSNFLAIRALQK